MKAFSSVPFIDLSYFTLLYATGVIFCRILPHRNAVADLGKREHCLIFYVVLQAVNFDRAYYAVESASIKQLSESLNDRKGFS